MDHGLFPTLLLHWQRGTIVHFRDQRKEGEEWVELFHLNILDYNILHLIHNSFKPLSSKTVREIILILNKIPESLKFQTLIVKDSQGNSLYCGKLPQ